MAKNKIRVFGILIFAIGILLILKDGIIVNDFINGVIIGSFTLGGLLLVINGKLNFEKKT
jgi:hypothetical protein